MLKLFLKKFMVFSLTCVLLCCCSVTPVFANDTKVSDEQMIKNIMQYPYGMDSLDENELEFLQKHPDIAEKRAAKDIDYLQDLNEKEMLNSEGDSTKSYETVWLGVDEIVSNCHTTDGGGSYSLLGVYMYDTDYSEEYADVVSQSIGIGSASAWAYVAPSILVCGSQGDEEWADITFDGYVFGCMESAAGGDSNVKVKLYVRDLTAGSYVASTTYIDEDGGITPTFVDEDIDRTFSVKLKAGHTYEMRFYISSASSMYSPQTAISDFYSGGFDYDGLDFYSVDIDF